METHAHLLKRWGPHRACPYCGGVDWHVDSEPLRLLTEEAVLLPMFIVGCAKCGHTTFVRADKVEAD